MPSRSRRPEFVLIVLTITLAGLAAAVLYAKPLLSRFEKHPPPPVELRVADQSGRMRVDWDPSNPLIQSAEGATLEVNDGGVFNRYPVDAAVLRSGGLDYLRRNDDVLLTITLYQDGQPGFKQTVRRIGAVPPTVVAEQKPEPVRRQTRSRRR